MPGIRLEPELEEKLDSLAKETGRSKTYYAREASGNTWKTVKTI